MRLKCQIVFVPSALNIDGNQVILDNDNVVRPPYHLSLLEKKNWLLDSIHNNYFVYDVEIHLNSKTIASTNPTFGLKPSEGLLKGLEKKTIEETLVVFSLHEGVTTEDGEEVPDGIPFLKPVLNKDGEVSTVPYNFTSPPVVEIEEMIKLFQMYNFMLYQCTTEGESCNIDEMLTDFLKDVEIIL